MPRLRDPRCRTFTCPHERIDRDDACCLGAREQRKVRCDASAMGANIGRTLGLPGEPQWHRVSGKPRALLAPRPETSKELRQLSFGPCLLPVRMPSSGARFVRTIRAFFARTAGEPDVPETPTRRALASPVIPHLQARFCAPERLVSTPGTTLIDRPPDLGLYPLLTLGPPSYRRSMEAEAKITLQPSGGFLPKQTAIVGAVVVAVMIMFGLSHSSSSVAPQPAPAATVADDDRTSTASGVSVAPTTTGSAAAAVSVSQASTFHGYSCTLDCSAHKMAYSIARADHLTRLSQCPAAPFRFRSFEEGCWAALGREGPLAK